VLGWICYIGHRTNSIKVNRMLVSSETKSGGAHTAGPAGNLTEHLVRISVHKMALYCREQLLVSATKINDRQNPPCDMAAHVPSTQECKTDLGKQVNLHGIRTNFPKVRSISGENVDLKTFQNSQI
jgi:hypothetical protein